MESPAPRPGLAEFLAAPLEQVVRAAPPTVLFAPGGTRRSAALAGVGPHSDDYANWSRLQMLGCLERLFKHGVRHLFAVMLRPAQVAETGPYRERLFDWLAEGLAGDSACADYSRLGWRARISGADEIAPLAAAAERLQRLSAPPAAPTVWFLLTASAEAQFRSMQRVLRNPEVTCRADAARLLYGEEIPPASLLLSFGKPLVGPDILPPFLTEEVQCYWSQRPGFNLDDQTLRHIIYDYAVLRRTWRKEKGDRYRFVLGQRSLWERTPALVLGLGRHLEGDFWYPQEPERSE